MFNCFNIMNNDMIIMNYKNEIAKLIDEIIEIDSQIFQYQYNQQQMMNQIFMQPMMFMNQGMMMPNMQNMPYMQFMQNMQFMTQQQIIEKKIQLYKEKFDKLTAEKIEKNNRYMIMNQMPLSQNNNNIINPMYNNMNNMYQNPMFMQMQMYINMIYDMQNKIMKQMSSFKNENSGGVKNLLVRVMMEDGKKIFVQCNSNDKLESALNNYKNKTLSIGNLYDYDFFIVKEKKAKIDSTFEGNGIKDSNFYITYRKKLNNSNENNIIEQNLNYNNEFGNNSNENNIIEQNLNHNNEPGNNSNDNLEINSINSGKKINISFVFTKGERINIDIDQNITFKDAVYAFCNKVGGISFDQVEKNIFFLFNGIKLDIKDKRKLCQFSFNSSAIMVVDNKNIIGA